MICALTVRRIAEGKNEEFIESFASGADQIPDEARDRFKGVYACEDVADPQVILTFGLFDGSIEELRELQTSGARSEQLDNIAPVVDEVMLDASFEVIREFVAEGRLA